MRLTITADPKDSSFLAAYIYFTEGEPPKVAKTVEVIEGECNVDLDAEGQPLGVELLVPGALNIDFDRATQKFRLPDVPFVRMAKAAAEN